MSTLNTGSICLTDLISKAKEGHSAYTKAANGKIYVNILIWENDEADKYGNTISLQLQSKKESSEREGKVYFGNAKKFEKKEPQSLSIGEANSMIQDDLSNLSF